MRAIRTICLLLPMFLLAGCSPSSLQRDDTPELVSSQFKTTDLTGSYNGHPMSVTFYLLLRNKEEKLNACGAYRINSGVQSEVEELIRSGDSYLIIETPLPDKAGRTQRNTPLVATKYFENIGRVDPRATQVRARCSFTDYAWTADIPNSSIKPALTKRRVMVY